MYYDDHLNLILKGSFPRLNSETDLNMSPTTTSSQQGYHGQHQRVNSFEFMDSNFDTPSNNSSFPTNPFASSPTTQQQRPTSPSMTGQGNFEPIVDTVPLLEELGINLKDIFYKSYFVLNPAGKTRRALAAGQISSSVDTQQGYALLCEQDLSGPILFALLLGLILLLQGLRVEINNVVGKLHFNYIYGQFVLGTILIFGLVHLMAHKSVSLSHTMTVLGYCLLPMVLSSFVHTIVIPLVAKTIPSLILPHASYTAMNAISIIWSTFSATQWMATIFDMREQSFLIAYPVFLFYSTFALLCFF